MEIDHEMISTIILLPSADSFKKGCCQLQAKVCAQITDRPAMTIAVDMGRKATKTNKGYRILKTVMHTVSQLDEYGK